jgi:hypothetical protein
VSYIASEYAALRVRLETGIPIAVVIMRWKRTRTVRGVRRRDSMACLPAVSLGRINRRTPHLRGINATNLRLAIDACTNLIATSCVTPCI